MQPLDDLLLPPFVVGALDYCIEPLIRHQRIAAQEGDPLFRRCTGNLCSIGWRDVQPVIIAIVIEQRVQ